MLFLRIETVHAQNFTSQQRTLQATIKSAYKSKKLTAKEYAKLLEEQEIIKTTILKAQADGVMTPDEKNRIHSKLTRARKRLAKYKTNREIY
ncbi:hypothetical protein IEE83_12840 [Dyadobacter sp. UP-52]|uniref:Uncharacterized protein n=2 Tax=Dyadobacter subterraneus TaxID=2773304 RepID=A0ABR9WBH4_9BACT|nr:hypothetical protein [Dyadobacter subterraneus]